jgi:hypothetical protein
VIKIINMDNCPICGGFLSDAGAWNSAGSRLIRKECNKCGTAFRGIDFCMKKRFELIRKGKSRKEREKIAYIT